MDLFIQLHPKQRVAATAAAAVTAATAATLLPLACLLQGCGPSNGPTQGHIYTYSSWSEPIRHGRCSSDTTPLEIPLTPKRGSSKDVLRCTLQGDIKAYDFPTGIFEIDEQLLVPERTSIVGAMSPNDVVDPTKTPTWKEQTLFLATRGVTDYTMNYCHAQDMVVTRVGFVLSSYVTVCNVSFQGVDTIRPNDNGALCGGGVFETKGCAENDCKASNVNNGGSDGIGSVGVIIDNVRLNDYYFAEDRDKIGAVITGNANCTTERWDDQCCFCRPNGVRSSQVAIWVPQTRNTEGTRNLQVRNVVSRSTQADCINLHGYVRDAVVQGTYCESTGDDVFALWGATSNPENITFADSIAVNPGILRPNWYGNCVATYGLKSVVFKNLRCKAPTLKSPIPSPSDGSIQIDTSMFAFHTSFDGQYPAGNTIEIRGWTFEDLQGKPYTLQDGSIDRPAPGKMAWSQAAGVGTVAAPYYFPGGNQGVNVHVKQSNGHKLVA